MQHLAPTRTAREAALRAGLLALAGVQLVTGLLLVLAPGSFYDAVANFGSRNDHDLRDMAAFYFASAAVLAIATSRRSWRAAVLAVVALQYGLHALNHVRDAGKADPSWVGPADAIALALGAAAIGWMLLAALRDEEGR
jgi:hypothetical protein